MKVLVIGGGAAGFFSAIHHKIHHPNSTVTIIERSRQLLTKVKISGGGRCNVTHACFDPNELSQNYPRGHRELRHAFKIFQPKDTMDWFQNRRVELKIESDGRVFPVSNQSSDIINCLMDEASKLGIQIRTKTRIQNI